MFYNNKNVETIVDGIYIYRNFIEKEYVDKINKIVYNAIGDYDPFSHPNNWYEDKTYSIPELDYAWEKASDLLFPEIHIVPATEVLITKTGDEMFVHTDSPENGAIEVNSPDPFQTCHIVDYGVLIYYGEWTGGNIFYPELNVEISPRPGDLVVHKSRHPYDHGVRKIESGIRAAQSMFALTEKDHPGTFPKYKSEEYYKIKSSNNKNAWTSPLNNIN